MRESKQEEWQKAERELARELRERAEKSILISRFRYVIALRFLDEERVAVARRITDNEVRVERMSQGQTWLFEADHRECDAALEAADRDRINARLAEPLLADGEKDTLGDLLSILGEG